ncbi:MAG TPA: helix-turn-helix domain-containing protein [Solirubrobacteraceae bacterium]|nr:helix-turn-helix domain-containing protein [Solirubrobacteraceae bacterium]
MVPATDDLDARPTLRAGWPVLGEVVANLDTDVLHVILAPRAAEARVTDVVILDPSDPGSVRAGAIVLGVGVSGSEGDAIALADRAGRAGVAAVVLRVEGDVHPRVVAIAESHELALLTVPPEMPWGQVYSLLRTAMVPGARGDAEAAGVAAGDLFALADAIAAAVGGPVTIEDPQWRVLAFSNLGHEIDETRRQVILGRGVPPVWQQRLEDASVARALRAGEGVVRFDGGGDPSLAPRMAAPVRAGSELLGSIWVAEAGTPFGEDAEAALLSSARLAAIHLMAHRATEDIRRRTRGAFVREVLDGRIPRGRAADGWPLRTRGSFTALVFSARSATELVGTLDAERVLSVITLYCEDVDADAMCALVDDRFWALIPGERRAGRERTVGVAEKIVERVERAIGVRLAAGVGMTVSDVAEVPRSRRSAEQALKVIAEREGLGPVAHIDDVRAHAVLSELLHLAEAEPGLLAGNVERLVAHDAQHGTEYVETLRVYLECWGDAAEAARRQGVHANTLRYRVKKLVELSGLDLDDPDERFVAELQLRLRGDLGARGR